jgi:hypothetical protein
MNLRLVSASLVILASVAAGFLFGAGPTSSPIATKWEYQSFSDLAGNTETANKLGSEGWELVAIIGPTGSKTCYYYFRRQTH